VQNCNKNMHPTELILGVICKFPPLHVPPLEGGVPPPTPLSFGASVLPFSTYLPPLPGPISEGAETQSYIRCNTICGVETDRQWRCRAECRHSTHDCRETYDNCYTRWQIPSPRNYSRYSDTRRALSVLQVVPDNLWCANIRNFGSNQTVSYYFIWSETNSNYSKFSNTYLDIIYT